MSIDLEHVPFDVDFTFTEAGELAESTLGEINVVSIACWACVGNDCVDRLSVVCDLDGLSTVGRLVEPTISEKIRISITVNKIVKKKSTHHPGMATTCEPSLL
jgi:hypothetical protein